MFTLTLYRKWKGQTELIAKFYSQFGERLIFLLSPNSYFVLYNIKTFFQVTFSVISFPCPLLPLSQFPFTLSCTDLLTINSMFRTLRRSAEINIFN